METRSLHSKNEVHTSHKIYQTEVKARKLLGQLAEQCIVTTAEFLFKPDLSQLKKQMTTALTNINEELAQNKGEFINYSPKWIVTLKSVLTHYLNDYQCDLSIMKMTHLINTFENNVNEARNLLAA